MKRWRVTRHARKRFHERGLSTASITDALNNPHTIRKQGGKEYRTSQSCTVVVAGNTIITVI